MVKIEGKLSYKSALLFILYFGGVAAFLTLFWLAAQLMIQGQGMIQSASSAPENMVSLYYQLGTSFVFGGISLAVSTLAILVSWISYHSREQAQTDSSERGEKNLAVLEEIRDLLNGFEEKLELMIEKRPEES